MNTHSSSRVVAVPGRGRLAADSAGNLPHFAVALARGGTLGSLLAEARRLKRGGNVQGVSQPVHMPHNSRCHCTGTLHLLALRLLGNAWSQILFSEATNVRLGAASSTTYRFLLHGCRQQAWLASFRGRCTTLTSVLMNQQLFCWTPLLSSSYGTLWASVLACSAMMTLMLLQRSCPSCAAACRLPPNWPTRCTSVFSLP